MSKVDEALKGTKYQDATKGSWKADDADLIWANQVGEYVGKAFGLDDQGDIELPAPEVGANCMLMADAKVNAALAQHAEKLAERLDLCLNLLRNAGVENSDIKQADKVVEDYVALRAEIEEGKG